ncbi:hypothetical protein [Anaerorhabdus sp.]|uniref:hypothetical protein n=1 Tax=Anaerorhabdus sp. TaxID=1872524 RepID=UPI002B1FBCAE|nr:hypothetical protein [Anaerorhabdus sp.]MEA4875908.1 hypothetical protein [Anaerorhabdus sp.]
MKKLVLKNKECFLFGIIILFSFLFQLIRARIGLPSADEQLYIVFPFRFFQGDLLFVDEWHSAQMIGVITNPLIALYYNLTKGSMEGVVYFFRISYIIMMTFLIIIIFINSKKNFLLILLLLLIYFSCPFNIMSLSYNTISVASLLLMFFVLLKFQTRISFVLSGVLFAIAVLCVPYLSVLYFSFIIVYFIAKIKIHNKDMKDLLWFTIGILIIFIIFLSIISKGNLEELIHGVKIILNDPSHDNGAISRILDYIIQYCRFSNIFLLIWGLITFKMYLNKRKNINNSRLLFFSVINCIVYILACFYIYSIAQYQYLFMNYIFMPALLGVNAILFMKENNRRLVLIYTISFSFSLLLNLQSNVGTQPITTGLIVPCFFSLFLLIDISNNIKIKSWIYILFTLLIVYLVYTKNYIYEYQSNYFPNVKIEEGLYKGIICEDSELEKLNDWNKEVIKINESIKNQNKRIFLYTYSPLNYMELNHNLRIGTFSTYIYLSDVQERDNLYSEYLQIKKNDIGYIYKPKINKLIIPSMDEYVNDSCNIIWESKDGYFYRCY